MIKRTLICLVVVALSGALWAQLPDAPTPQPGAGLPAQGEQPQAQQPAQPVAPPPEQPQAPAEPSSQIQTVPAGKAPNAPGSGPDELSRIIVNVNYVLVPVRVKDSSGHDVYGLTKENFSLYENNQHVPIKFFTSDPFPLSAAILVDVGLPDIALDKVRSTYSALIGAFGPYDEVAVYTYGNTVHEQQPFLAATSEKTAVTFRHVKTIQGSNAGAPVYNPMTTGPSVNGRVFDQGQQRSALYAPPKNESPSRVLNDAILQAAVDLSRRDRARRKVIFIISDGRESGSTASYADVLKVLLSGEVSVYGVAVDSAAIPGYNKLERIRLPRQPVGNILPKYASATGGQVYTDFAASDMESAYADAAGEARNQYTIGYTSPSPAASSDLMRIIEVRVNRAGLKVFARAGYYPLPAKASPAPPAPDVH